MIMTRNSNEPIVLGDRGSAVLMADEAFAEQECRFGNKSPYQEKMDIKKKYYKDEIANLFGVNMPVTTVTLEEDYTQEDKDRLAALEEKEKDWRDRKNRFMIKYIFDNFGYDIAVSVADLNGGVMKEWLETQSPCEASEGQCSLFCKNFGGDNCK